MRVCLVSTAFPRWKGDYRGSFVLEAAKALQARGVEVHVIASHYPGSVSKERIEGINVSRPRYMIPERFEILQKQSEGLPLMWRESTIGRIIVLPYMLSMGIAIAKHARKCDLIHANWTLSAALAQLTRFYHRRPIITTVHGSDIYQAAQIPVIRNATRYFLNKCEKIIAVSKSLKQETIGLGVPRGKIEVVPDGVDIGRFTPTSAGREPIILFVGSLIDRKGLRYLFEAMQIISLKFPQYALVIVGEGPQLIELERLAKSLGLIDQIKFAGPQSPEQVRLWMQKARLLVLPSIEEGLGVVVLEALASGIPCIASNVGGIPDLISKDVGVLVPPRDPSSLSQAIAGLLEDDLKWHEMSINARALVERKFSWVAVSKQLIELYEETLRKSPFRPSDEQA